MSTENIEHAPVASPLIGRDDPPPFAVLHEHGSAPALVICDHASRAFPKGMKRLGLPELPSWQHIAWDIGAGELARGISNLLDAPAVGNQSERRRYVRIDRFENVEIGDAQHSIGSLVPLKLGPGQLIEGVC